MRDSGRGATGDSAGPQPARQQGALSLRYGALARQQRARRRLMALLATALLAACQTGGPQVEAPQTALAFDAGLVSTRPTASTDSCWAEHLQPALFETVTEQREVRSETRDASGALLTPAVLRSETHQRELRPRQTLWFRTPCAAEIGPADIFTASLQRALKARGLYGGAITGETDRATTEALRRYQAGNGLDSPVLSLAAAHALGLAVRD